MKAKIGQYVRSVNGFIGKTKEINKDEYCGTYYVIEKPMMGIISMIDEERLSLVSNDLLDLLKPMDLLYVNIDPNDGWGGIIAPRIPETQRELEKIIYKIKTGAWQLVWVVTYEVQMYGKFVNDKQ